MVPKLAFEDAFPETQVANATPPMNHDEKWYTKKGESPDKKENDLSTLRNFERELLEPHSEISQKFEVKLPSSRILMERKSPEEISEVGHPLEKSDTKLTGRRKKTKRYVLKYREPKIDPALINDRE